MSASPRFHSRTYFVTLDRPWTSFGRNCDVNGTSEMRNKRLVHYETQKRHTLGSDVTNCLSSIALHLLSLICALHKLRLKL
ncbi:hypothetical protein OUZ56_005958 [Daphnia magna]|uniref:Uncharacterized protein n=1 Tax=Daphnia magna TaxID=35525 RepID=A0ABQ9YUC4_9CRUS|nr:hypothetical protein OUZ56_005958 [Daphnia magna]